MSRALDRMQLSPLAVAVAHSRCLLGASFGLPLLRVADDAQNTWTGSRLVSEASLSAIDSLLVLLSTLLGRSPSTPPLPRLENVLTVAIEAPPAADDADTPAEASSALPSTAMQLFLWLSLPSFGKLTRFSWYRDVLCVIV